MDPFLGVMFVVWFIKILAEDGYSTYKGTSNPRLDRRKARQKSRAGNPIWQQFVGWMADVAEDARKEAARARQEKRDRQAEARRKRDLEEHETVDAEYEIDPVTGYNPDPRDPSVVDMGTPPPRQPDEETEEDQPKEHKDLTADECTFDICPIHGNKRKTDNQQPEQAANLKENENMGANDTGEIYGLDQCIAYCEALSASFENHTAAGASGEQYTGMLADAKVQGMSLQTAHEMQAAIASAVSAIEAHKVEMEAQKLVQEAYDANSDAGDKEFQQAGR